MQQRGTVRRRSIESDNDPTITQRPSRRPRHATSATHSHSSSMGAPTAIHNGANNGVATGVTDDAAYEEGPYIPPPSVLDQIRPYEPAGTLMYEDDRDWKPQEVDVSMDGTDSSGEPAAPPIRKQDYSKRMPIDREEIVRLMLQGLEDLGYQQAASVLSKESGFTTSSPAAAEFQEAILGGRWSEALHLLPELGIVDHAASMAAETSSSRSSIASGKTKAADPAEAQSPANKARFLIARQKYLELLEGGQQKKALAVLRSELAAATTQDPEALHDLSGFMMCLDQDELYERAKWDGAAGTSRRLLLERLQEHISPKVMLPSRRLATLLDQARQHQQLSCLYHDDNEPVSLYNDHQCESGTFPTVTTHILQDHTDEVWRIEWSPSGDMLASASKDRTVMIWKLKPPEHEGMDYGIEVSHRLSGHTAPVDALAWSPDSKTLVTCSDKQVYLWDAVTGARKHVPNSTSPHTDTISAVQWLPDGSKFVVSSLDCYLVFYDASGTVLHKWNINSIQISDFAITPDGSKLVAATTILKRTNPGGNGKMKPSISARVVDGTDTATWAEDGLQYNNMDHGLVVINLADRDIVEYVTDMKCSGVTSIKLSHDGRRALISCTPDQMQLYSLDPHPHFVRQYMGHVQSRFLIRSGFGAPKDRFVLSGSEDGHVYVWQSNSNTPLHVLSGHTDTVNAVAWNPVLSRKLFASCSDDHQIHIWQPPGGRVE
ncbi:negative regulation of gluconeogenesis-related protein [Trichosporon asahii var. asahii CBS 8904]|uniref:Negative regulation of gluconeogenesis-related protein n=2 Tax=Trichosporon asahii var. asahii TaxID=189963 RepID=K1VFZ2_TRIAC|nr:negative regulation of gluconeogenesis-related protein [Trichosporon asahii var. asahii CBS 2479]EJT52339.1 negative regulation of gluconeogenesis-related protein [Trichosporon asahii var. asahii CBS 2479]EKC99685.1 negative regulation of gluconeogenesis-related protein [Trichosporon asahii var. asahii CBS 8904]